MRVRNAADHRALFWALVLFPLVPAIDYAVPSAALWLLPVGLYLAYCAGVLTHNHNHCPVFRERRANRAYSLWLSFFYGAPVFTWIPTHNQNHHRFVNGPGDATSTARYGRRNTLFSALTYPFASAVWQAGAIGRYLREARRDHPRRYRHLLAQYAAVLGGHSAFFMLAIALHGWTLGPTTYGLSLGLPALFATWSMMFTNYVQHVDCDALSPNNHSRNFVAPVTNWFVFDAGFHTVHHENPGVHWSRYRALHHRRAPAIDPRLNERSILAYCVKAYFIAPLARRIRARNPAPYRAAA